MEWMGRAYVYIVENRRCSKKRQDFLHFLTTYVAFKEEVRFVE